MAGVARHPTHFYSQSTFYKQAANGTLPAFSYFSPTWQVRGLIARPPLRGPRRASLFTYPTLYYFKRFKDPFFNDLKQRNSLVNINSYCVRVEKLDDDYVVIIEGWRTCPRPIPSSGLTRHRCAIGCWQACDHPCQDLAKGDRLLKDVYEALRAGPKWCRRASAPQPIASAPQPIPLLPSSCCACSPRFSTHPAWPAYPVRDNTLFLLAYDDIGGYFDHIIPPSENVPAPEAPVRSTATMQL